MQKALLAKAMLFVLVIKKLRRILPSFSEPLLNN
jgi:hypothetical protein